MLNYKNKLPILKVTIKILKYVWMHHISFCYYIVWKDKHKNKYSICFLVYIMLLYCKEKNVQDVLGIHLIKVFL